MKQVFDTNVFGLMRVTRSLLPLMRNGGKKGGRVINIGGVSSVNVPIPLTAINGASKAAVLSLTHSLNMELARFDIKCIAVCPDDRFNTQMFNEDRLLRNLNSEIERTKPEIVESYGGVKTLENIRQIIGKALPRFAYCDPNIVVDAIEHAVVSSWPRAEYYPVEWGTRILTGAYATLPHNLFRRFVSSLPFAGPEATRTLITRA